MTRVLRILGFSPSLSAAWEAVGRMERSTHRYRLTVDRSGSTSVEVFFRLLTAQAHFTRWADGSTSLSGEARLEPWPCEEDLP